MASNWEECLDTRRWGTQGKMLKITKKCYFGYGSVQEHEQEEGCTMIMDYTKELEPLNFCFTSI